jgi:hypothetical protein
MDFHTLLGGQTLQLDETPIPVSLQGVADEFDLSHDVVHMLSAIQIDGRQPSHREDWLFLLLAIRRACRVMEPLETAGAMSVRGEKYALRG